MQTSKIDAILSAWKDEGESLHYREIKQFVVYKGIIKETNDRSLSRWLKNLVKDGLLQKSEKGYTLKKRPKVYQVFDYLDELRQKYGDHIYEGEIGGIISRVCALTYLSFNENFVQTKEERIVLDALSVRIGELFWALYELRNILLKRRCGLPRLRLPDDVVRETFFHMLVKSIGKHCATEELVKKYSGHLTSADKQVFNCIWEINHQRPEFGYDNIIEHDMFFDKIEANPQFYKKELKKEEKLDLDKYTAEELAEKYVQIEERIRKNHEKDMETKHSFSYSQQEAELESKYRTATLTKLAERIRAINGTTEDFAIVVTRHPATLNEFYTPEHVLHEAIEWARKPPEDDKVGERIWQENYEDEETFEGMVAERLIAFGRFPARTYSKMMGHSWLKKELSGLGDFKKILRLYTKKRRRQLQEDRTRSRRFLDQISDFAQENPHP
jgi:hypothetical protein